MSSDMREFLRQNQNKEDIRVEQKEEMKKETTKATELNDGGVDSLYLETKHLPCGIFYPQGSSLLLRIPTVREIINFSQLNTESDSDLRFKIDQLLSSCVQLVTVDGQKHHYNYVKEADRTFILSFLRDATFSYGNNYELVSTCPKCEKKANIPFKMDYIEVQKPDESIMKYFSEEYNCFVFPLKSQSTWCLGQCNIGTGKVINQYYNQLPDEKKNEPAYQMFFKILPMLMYEWEYPSFEQIDQAVNMFMYKDGINVEDFAILQKLVDKTKCGIKGIKYKCSCGQEVRARVRFRNRLKDYFDVRGELDELLREPLSVDETKND